MWTHSGMRGLAKRDGSGQAVLWLYRDLAFHELQFKVRTVTGRVPRPKVRTFPAATLTKEAARAEFRRLHDAGFVDWRVARPEGDMDPDFREARTKVFGVLEEEAPPPVELHCIWAQVRPQRWVRRLARNQELTRSDPVAHTLYGKLRDAVDFPRAGSAVDVLRLHPREGSLGLMLLTRLCSEHAEHAWLEREPPEEGPPQRLVLHPDSTVFRLWADIDAPFAEPETIEAPKYRLAIF